MSSTATNLALALKAEFDLMNQQVYPYVESGTHACTMVKITNIGTAPVIIYPTTLLKFDDGLGVVYPEEFYPRISSSITLNPPSGSIAGGSIELLFESNTDNPNIPSTALMKLYNDNVQILNITLVNTDIVSALNETLYYFVYRMTQIFMDSINAANIDDPDEGSLTVSFNDLKSALAYAWPNILQMQTDPRNSHITTSIDTYLDTLTHRYFYNARTYQPHPVRTMTETACDDLDNIDLSTTPDAATQLSSEMMADIVDYYCNDGLS